MAKQVAASQGMHVGKLLASLRRRISLAVHIAHADNVLRGAASAAESVAGASDSRGVPSSPARLGASALALMWGEMCALRPFVPWFLGTLGVLYGMLPGFLVFPVSWSPLLASFGTFFSWYSFDSTF